MEQVGVCASNSFPDVVMGDPESLENKIAAIRADGPQKLQVLSSIFFNYSRTSVFCSQFLLFHFRNFDWLQCLWFSMLEILVSLLRYHLMVFLTVNRTPSVE